MEYDFMPPPTLRPSDIRDELSAYEMPKARQGMPVIWYSKGKPTPRTGRGAFVVEVMQSRVHLVVPGDPYPIRESVPHVSDPHLKLGEGHMENGAWDYTEQFRLDQERLNLIELQVDQLCEKFMPEGAAPAETVARSDPASDKRRKQSAQ